MYYLRYVYTWIKKHAWLQTSSVFFKTRDFSRSQTFTYAVNVVMYRKRCKMESMLLQITNRKRYMTYRIAAIPMTLSDLQCHSHTASIFKCYLFRTAVKQLSRFQLTYCVECSLCDSCACCFTATRTSKPMLVFLRACFLIASLLTENNGIKWWSDF